MKTALVCDDLTQFGGAEKVLLAMAEIFPQAPIYTSVYDKNLVKFDSRFANLNIRTSFLQKYFLTRNFPKAFFFLHPLAYENFNFDEYDLVISTSSRFAHAVITKPRTLHISYFYTPARFLWEEEKYFAGFKKTLLSPIISHLRRYDKIASCRPDYLLATSRFTAERIKKIYGQEAEVLYPPVASLTSQALGRSSLLTPSNSPSTSSGSNRDDVKDDFAPSLLNTPPIHYFLIVSRLVPWKKVDIAVEAANKLGINLKIVGRGPEENKLQRIAKKDIEFLGFVSDEKLAELYQNCQALIMTQEEDFGLTSLEAQSFGKPVIAYRGGGALETIIEGKTGQFFFPQTSEALIKTLQNFSPAKFKPEDCQKNAAKFSKEAFQINLKNFIRGKLQEYRASM